MRRILCDKLIARRIPSHIMPYMKHRTQARIVKSCHSMFTFRFAVIYTYNESIHSEQPSRLSCELRRTLPKAMETRAAISHSCSQPNKLGFSTWCDGIHMPSINSYILYSLIYSVSCWAHLFRNANNSYFTHVKNVYTLAPLVPSEHTVTSIRNVSPIP